MPSVAVSAVNDMVVFCVVIELMERCRTPPRCRSPSITRRSNEPRKHWLHFLYSVLTVHMQPVIASITLQLGTLTTLSKLYKHVCAIVTCIGTHLCPHPTTFCPHAHLSLQQSFHLRSVPIHSYSY